MRIYRDNFGKLIVDGQNDIIKTESGIEVDVNENFKLQNFIIECGSGAKAGITVVNNKYISEIFCNSISISKERIMINNFPVF